MLYIYDCVCDVINVCYVTINSINYITIFMYRYDHQERLTAVEAQNHRFFDEVREV